jgi:HEAT repeat protein
MLNTHLERLQHADHDVRGRAALALRTLGDVGAVDGLIRALCTEPSPFVRENITAALVQVVLVRLLGHQSRELQSTLASVLEGFGVPAVLPLLDMLADERWQAREQAAYILGLIGRRDAVPALTKTLSDRHWQVRFASVHALGDLGGEISRQAVQSMHDDSDPRVRSLAPQMLKRIEMSQNYHGGGRLPRG